MRHLVAGVSSKLPSEMSVARLRPPKVKVKWIGGDFLVGNVGNMSLYASTPECQETEKSAERRAHCLACAERVGKYGDKVLVAMKAIWKRRAQDYQVLTAYSVKTNSKSKSSTLAVTVDDIRGAEPNELEKQLHGALVVLFPEVELKFCRTPTLKFTDKSPPSTGNYVPTEQDNKALAALPTVAECHC